MDDVSVPDDADIVIILRDAFETDLEPIPHELSHFAIDAFAWRLIDDELATITFDSDSSELVGVRGTASQRRSVTFQGRGLTVSVSLSDTSVVASIEPPASYLVRVQGYEAEVELRSDDSGQVAVADYPVPLRLVIESGGGRLVSPWIIG